MPEPVTKRLNVIDRLLSVHTEDEALLAALRSLWPILGESSRREAVNIAAALKRT